VAYTQRFAGERLRDRRRELGLSATALANAAGLSRGAVKSMERNRIRPSDATFTRLSNVLGLTAGDARARLMVPGPPDHRPTEFASEAKSAESNIPRQRTRRLAAMLARRGDHR
jgi:transcriptional regulator with XRE-family HTH domain